MPRARNGAASDTTVRVGTFQSLPSVLRRLGVDPEEVLADVGLELALFDNAENRVSSELRGRLFRCCVERTGCGHVGLLIGQDGGLHSFGLVGALLKHAPDVGTAIRALITYMHAYVRGASMSLTVEDDTALFSYHILRPGSLATDQIGDGVVAMMFKIVSEFFGRDRKPSAAWFAHVRPDNLLPYRKYFGVPLNFDAEHYAVSFPARWLKLPLGNSDPELRRLLQRQIRELELKFADDFPEQVRRVLRTGIPAGHSSAEQVAALFSIHSRTLHRRLIAAGTGFRELLEQEQFELASQMREKTTLEVKQIASSLGYARADAFTRAYRRWSGKTPVAWRASRVKETNSAIGV